MARQLVGLEVDWVEVEEQFDKFGLYSRSAQPGISRGGAHLLR